MAVWSMLKLSELIGPFRLDAECYTPRMLRDQYSLARFKTIKLSTIAFVTDGQHGYHEVDEESEIRHLTAKCVGPGVVFDNGADRLARSTHEANPGSELRADDVLLSTAGTIGEAGIVTASLLPANIDQDVAMIRVQSGSPVHPYFIAAFLRSEYGQFQCSRATTGQIQGHINLAALRQFDIPILAAAPRVVDAMRQGMRNFARAEDSITAAEGLLMSELGLDHLDLTPSKCYERPFQDLQAGNRFGAEYFMPCKRRVLDAMSAIPHRPLSGCADSIRQMWDPRSVKSSAQVRNFDLSHALDPFLDDVTDPTEAGEIGSSKKMFQGGDVLVSRLRSYLKEIAIARTSADVPCVGSSEFIVLRPQTGGLSAETLMIFLRCPLVQTVLKWSQDGSNHPRFCEEDLLALPVPNKVLAVQPKIDRLVNEVIASRQEAARLLEKAKRAVEEMIAGGKSVERG